MVHTRAQHNAHRDAGTQAMHVEHPDISIPKHMAFESGTRRLGDRKKHHKKPSKRFQAMVHDALMEDKVKGVYTEVEWGTMDSPVDGGQTPFYWGTVNGPTGSQLINGNSWSCWDFETYWVLDAAACLFTGKTATQNSGKKTFASGQIGYLVDSNIAGNTGANNNLDQGTTTLYIKNSFVRYELKNNSERIYTIAMYEFAPKEPMAGQELGGAPTGVPSDPLDAWAAALQADYADGVNRSGATIATLYTTPHLARDMSRFFSMKKELIILEPGQTYSFKVQGPNEMDFDPSTFLVPAQYNTSGTISSYFLNIQRWCRCPIFVVHADLGISSGSASGRPGRHNDANLGSGLGIVLERYKYISFEVPQGICVNNTSAQVIARGKRYSRQVWPNSGFVPGNNVEVLAEQPATTTTG